MVITELALGYLANLLYDSSKKIPGIILDANSKVYKKAIKELNNKYRLNGARINTFLQQENVKAAIKECLGKPNNSDYLTATF